MVSVSASIDVPSLEQDLNFYSTFGFSKVAEPYPGVMVRRAGDITIYLLEKQQGSKPSPHMADTRSYQRHWTPVHLDFHVDNLSETVDRVVAAGAVVEQRFDTPNGAAVFCSDPFGHGFCLIQRRLTHPS